MHASESRLRLQIPIVEDSVVALEAPPASPCAGAALTAVRVLGSERGREGLGVQDVLLQIRLAQIGAELVAGQTSVLGDISQSIYGHLLKLCPLL